VKPIDTEKYSRYLRQKSLMPGERKVLIARLAGSLQETDLSEPVNCNGFGRIRHFRLQRDERWSPNPLPILPAMRALGRAPDRTLRAQVFQNAACNWRCWYCYVDFDRLAADTRVAAYFTADELIDLFLAQPSPPDMLDLSGGQPDITPEWIAWTIDSLVSRSITPVFLWSDDNLSTRYYWQYLSKEQRKAISRYPLYARVGCFKGYDSVSFAFNTRAVPELFAEQLSIFRELLNEGLDLYAYVTLTAPPHPRLHAAVESFVDRLQTIHRNLPLRTVPLRIEAFAPTRARVEAVQNAALTFQYDVHAAWREELMRRFSPAERATAICEVSLS
jgi:uncharacterized Fe-S cluster-containing radical SAM superfamily protein